MDAKRDRQDRRGSGSFSTRILFADILLVPDALGQVVDGMCLWVEQQPLDRQNGGEADGTQHEPDRKFVLRVDDFKNGMSIRQEMKRSGA